MRKIYPLLIGILALFASSCGRLVLGEHGPVTAVNFIPGNLDENKNPSPFVYYFTDVDGVEKKFEIDKDYHLAVGDYLGAFYTEQGYFIRLRKISPPEGQ